jgi:hypothetical protein
MRCCPANVCRPRISRSYSAVDRAREALVSAGELTKRRYCDERFRIKRFDNCTKQGGPGKNNESGNEEAANDNHQVVAKRRDVTLAGAAIEFLHQETF